MRRPYTASERKRKNVRLRLLKKGPGEQIPRLHPNERKTGASLGTASCRPHSLSADAPASRNDNIEEPQREPARCVFGAVRVGALLGRLRLHLQTDRFLAVHRGDDLWAAGCLEAALALAEIVSRMVEGEMDAPLPPQPVQNRPVSGAPVPPPQHTQDRRVSGAPVAPLPRDERPECCAGLARSGQ